MKALKALKAIVKLRFQILFKIFFYIALSIILIVVILSQFLYRSFEKEGLNIAYTYNQKVLTQLSYDISYMNDMVKSFMIVQYQTPGNQQIMHREANNNFFDTQKFINQFRNSVTSNSMISTAVLYNQRIPEYASTFYGSADNYDEQLKSLIKNPKEIKVLQPIPRLLSKDVFGVDNDVFTYFLYDDMTSDGEIDGALIVNVKSEWLRNNLIKSSSKDTKLTIIDHEGQVIVDSSRQQEMFSRFNETYMSKIRESQDKGNSFIHDDKVVSYFSIPQTTWMLVAEEPYKQVFEPIRKVRTQTLGFTLIFLTVGLIVAIYISRRIYRPYGNLVKMAQKWGNTDLAQSHFNNESEFLTKAMDISFAMSGDFEKYKTSTLDIVADNHLKSILLESNYKKSSEVPNDKLDEWLNGSTDLLLFVFKIDQMRLFDRMNKEEKRLVYFALTNIANEVFGHKHAYMKTSMGNGEFVYVLESATPPENWAEQIQSMLSITRRISQGITISAAISDPIQDASQLHLVYMKTVQMFEYRIFYGNSSILLTSSIHHRDRSQRDEIPDDKINKFIECLKAGNYDSMKAHYEEIVKLGSNGDGNQLILSLVRLVFSINKALQELNLNRMEPIEFHVSSYCGELMNQGTLDGIHEQFYSLLLYIADKLKVDTSKKHNILVHSILDYIHEEYEKGDIGLKEIAAAFKMSPGYMGQIFREAMNKSIAQYIHDLRLEKVMDLLRLTNLSVRDIIFKVGYSNEANFYKLFKKQYGITPNEYRQNILLQTREREDPARTGTARHPHT